MVIGPLCDKFGPRITYTWLLALGALPVIGIAFAHDYMTFLIFRLAIGAIGASFVITQFHTSVMFAPNVVGTANATVGGWGNAGGGVTQSVMPYILALIVGAGASQFMGWRVAMIVPGVLMLVMAVLYWTLTQDTPEGNIPDAAQTAVSPSIRARRAASPFSCRLRPTTATWVLAVAYGASFGLELFIHGNATIYFVDHYKLDIESAGLAVGAFGLLALFARALGGIASDKVAGQVRAARPFSVLLARC